MKRLLGSIALAAALGASPAYAQFAEEEGLWSQDEYGYYENDYAFETDDEFGNWYGEAEEGWNEAYGEEGLGFGEDYGLAEGYGVGEGYDQGFGWQEGLAGIGSAAGFGEGVGFGEDNGLWNDENWASDDYGYYDENFAWETDDGFDNWYAGADQDWGGFYDDVGDEGLFDV